MPDIIREIIQVITTSAVLAILYFFWGSTSKLKKIETNEEEQKEAMRGEYANEIRGLEKKANQMFNELVELIKNPQKEVSVKGDELLNEGEGPTGYIPPFLEGQDEIVSRIALYNRKRFEEIDNKIMSLGDDIERRVTKGYIAYSVKGAKGINPLVTLRTSLQVYIFPKASGGVTKDESLKEYDSDERSLNLREGSLEKFEGILKEARNDIKKIYTI